MPGTRSVLAALICLAAGILPVAMAEQLPVRVYTIAEGLSQDAISDIEWDPRGFLWFSTSDGISRFDGQEFTTYGTTDGLTGNLTTDLLITRSGQYWIAANPGGLFRINDEAVRSGSSSRPLFLAAVSRDLPAVVKLIENRAGEILCATTRGVFQLSGEGERRQARLLEFGTETGSSEIEAAEMIEDGEDGLWIGASTGLYRRDANGHTTWYTKSSGLPSDFITALLRDRDGTLWVGTGLGLCRITPEPDRNKISVSRVFTTSDGLPSDLVNTLLETSDGTLWAGTIEGLAELLPEDQLFRGYTRRDGLSDDIIRALAEDPDGNLWVGTESGGAVRIARRGFTSYREEDGLAGGRIASIFQTRAGGLCVVDSRLSLHEFQRRSFRSVRPRFPAHVTHATWGWHQIVLQDHTGEWWIPTGEGLCRFPAAESVEELSRLPAKAFYTKRDGLGGDDIFRLFEDSNGDIWISAITPVGQEVLTRWERATGTFHRYGTRDGIPHAAPTAFCETPGGDLWIGFYTGGVARLRSGRFTMFTNEDGAPEGLIGSIFADSAGRLWIASALGGVVRVDDPTAARPRFTRYTKGQGLSSDNVKTITEDRLGRIYIGTARGLDRLDPATGRIRHYTTAEGLANNYVNVAFCDREGVIWVGTLQGLSRFVPELVSESERAPLTVLIRGIRIGGTSYPVSRFGQTDVAGIEVDSRDVQIDFLGISYAAGETVRYRYRLEGGDSDWSPPREDRSVNFARLSPGSYRFLVDAIRSDGAVSSQPATVAFTILPPIWRRWWFLSIAAGVVSASFYAAYRYRVSKLLELLRVRTRISRDLHDDVGASLTRIAILSEIARKRIGDAHEDAVGPLNAIAESAREVVDSMSDVVWASDPTQDDLASLVHRIRKFASDLLEARSIRWDVHPPADMDKVRLKPDQRRQVYLIFKEAVNNVVRHSECSSVQIELAIRHGELEGKIADDGKGFACAATRGSVPPARSGRGLASMRARAEQMGGSLKIETAPSRGTLITFAIPLRQHIHAPPDRRPMR